jgi:aryl-alcohol dehydrogenase-like predicted oxidoreductase
VKLALGTVQFGMPYGIANQEGKVRHDEIAIILAFAREVGISMLDTAIAYGDSEASLGAAGVADLRVITKLPAVPEGETVIPWILAQVQASLSRLGVSSIYGLLLHRPEQLAGVQGAAIAEALNVLKTEGLVRKVGVSIYAPDELEYVTRACSVDLVQAPFNVFDRRMQRSGWMARLQTLGVELHIRSIFLQGLLLIPPERRPRKFDCWAPLWKRWDEWLAATDQTPLQGALRFVLAQCGVAKAVVGVDGLAQLKEIVDASKGSAFGAPDDLASEELDLINPARWPALN